MTKKELLKIAKSLKKNEVVCCIIWTREDVVNKAENNEYQIPTKDQCDDILYNMDSCDMEYICEQFHDMMDQGLKDMGLDKEPDALTKLVKERMEKDVHKRK